MGNKFLSSRKRRGETSTKRRERRGNHCGTEHHDSLLERASAVEEAARERKDAPRHKTTDDRTERKSETEGRGERVNARSIQDEKRECGSHSVTASLGHPAGHEDLTEDMLNLAAEQRSPELCPVQRVVELQLSLHSKATRAVHTLRHVPPTVHALKEYIQYKHNVPVCCQRILFDAVPLRDHETLPLHYMRTGDTLDVHFLSEADIEYISKVLNTLNRVVTYLDSVAPHLCRATSIQTHMNIQHIEEIESMSLEYFHCVSTEQSQANFYFFCENNGPQLIFQLQKQLLTHPWEGLPDILKLLENSSQLLCWDMTELSVMCKMPGLRDPLLSVIMLIASGTRAKKCSYCKSYQHHQLLTAAEDKLLFQQTNYRVLPALTK